MYTIELVNDNKRSPETILQFTLKIIHSALKTSFSSSVYWSNEPLIIKAENGEYLVEDDGKLRVINSITFWLHEWSIKAAKGTAHSLNSDRYYTNGNPLIRQGTPQRVKIQKLSHMKTLGVFQTLPWPKCNGQSITASSTGSVNRSWNRREKLQEPR